MCVNALNGLLSFLLMQPLSVEKMDPQLCQRPKRASFISTYKRKKKWQEQKMCQRPKRASFISTRFEYAFFRS